ncbi:hypothetical protein AB431_23355 [Mycobacterium sp. EPa45]|nr:hypothetical protein AB431_23355 [Mycobacterium sp. EPa45]
MVLEVGPSAVTRLSPRSRSPVEAELVAVALAGIDDTVVLFRERPVAVADLWRRIIASSAERHCESMTVVHPTWWTEDRVAKIVDAAATVAAEVHARPRSAVLADGEVATVVEIADDLIAISAGGLTPVIQTRTDTPADVAAIIETRPGTAVLIDAPPTVPGSGEYARGLRAVLRHRGVDARMVRIRGPATPLPGARSTVASAPRRRWRGPLLVAAGMALTLCAIGVTVARNRTPAPTSNAVLIVEGRIAVRIPSDWVVTRITAGPGSRRVQASSLTESNVALHVTQSYSPGDTLARAAEVLSKAVNVQSGEVFVDFNPADRRGGRPAVTYRELRISREIRWAVILDGSTRISIGCQSEPGRPDTVARACEQAIETAREVDGTNRAS